MFSAVPPPLVNTVNNMWTQEDLTTFSSTSTPLCVLGKNFCFWRGGTRKEGVLGDSGLCIINTQGRTGLPGWSNAIFNGYGHVSVVIPWVNDRYFLSTQGGSGLSTIPSEVIHFKPGFIPHILGGCVGGDDLIMGWLQPPLIHQNSLTLGMKKPMIFVVEKGGMTVRSFAKSQKAESEDGFVAL